MGDAASYEKLQSDKVRAERNAYALLDALAPGVVIGNRSEIVTRVVGKLTPGDLQSGQIGTAALGEIIDAVETAKGNTAFNWNAATPEQIKAYLLGKGVDPALAALRAGIPARGNTDGNPNTSGGTGNHATVPGTYNGSIGSITPYNYGETPYMRAGLSYAVFNNLLQYHFTGAQILGGVNDAKNILGPRSTSTASMARRWYAIWPACVRKRRSRPRISSRR